MSAHREPSRATARSVEVDADAAGQRLDNFVMRALRGVPPSRVYRLL
ncbi:MAG: RluA family pseudouridine synthase, partial [Proteobacteria bacterium SW_6_67_9]